jgi:hypothetical protein
MAPSDIAKRVRDPRIYRDDAALVAFKAHLAEAADLIHEDRPSDAVALEAMAEKLEGCRYGHAARDHGCGAYTFRPASCHVRLCPHCERARAGRLVGRYNQVATAMQEPRIWTLTVPNVAPDELDGGIGVLLDALDHLRHMAIFAGGPCRAAHRAAAYTDVDRGEHHPSGDDVEPCSHPPHRHELAACGSCRCPRCLEVDVERAGQRVTLNGCPRCIHEPVRGGVYSIEVTWSLERRDWHPHAHLLVDAPWIAWSEMRDAWRAVTCDAIRRAEARQPNKVGVDELAGGPFRLTKCEHRADAQGMAAGGCRGASIVWVSAVQGQPDSPERRAAVRETLKYVSKGLLDRDGHLLPGASSLELAELVLAIRGRRLVNGWGSFRNVHDDEDELDPAEVLVGPGVPPEMIGLPRICPSCGRQAEWEYPIPVARINCFRLDRGYLVWQPPP